MNLCNIDPMCNTIVCSWPILVMRAMLSTSLPLPMTHLPHRRAPPVAASNQARWRGLLLAFIGRHPLPSIAFLIVWRPTH